MTVDGPTNVNVYACAHVCALRVVCVFLYMHYVHVCECGRYSGLRELEATKPVPLYDHVHLMPHRSSRAAET